MIKTTSFAPPRPAKKQRQSLRASGSPVSENRISTARPSQSGISRADAKILTSVRRSAAPDSPTIPVPAKSAKLKTAKVTGPEEMTLAFDFEAPAPVSPPVKTVEAPVAPKAKATKPKIVTPAPEPVVEAAAPKATAKAETLKVVTPKKTATPKVVVAPSQEAPTAAVVEAVEEVVAPVAKKSAPKSKRVRVPENLAEQYGAKLSKRVESGATEIPTEDAPKKRLNKAEREARKQLLRPDEGLLERLQRAANLIPTKKPTRQRGWKFDCGRCGRTSYFQTPNADICVCGAIAVKE